MEYHVTLIDRMERETQIKRSADVSKDKIDFFDLRHTKTELPVIRLPVNLPVYRMINFRTFSDQAEYLAREHKSPEYFSSGQENESVQQIQHEFLARLAEKGKADSVIPIVDVLQRERQREPILITRRGVVVNGNRRLAAMRELFANDSAANQDFGYVNCAVLPPDITAYDILEIEAVLQARPETRLDYDWIADAQLLSALLKAKKTPEAVAELLGRKVNEVKNTLQAMAEADVYLKDWAHAESEYNRVADNGEQFFNDLPGQLEKKSPNLQDASRAIAWTLFDNRDKLDGRLYRYNLVFGKRAEDVLDRLAGELGLSLDTKVQDGAGDYDFDIGEDTAAVSYQPIINALRDKDRQKEAVEALIEISASVLESDKQEKSGGAALKAITSAHAKLAEVDISRASDETHSAIERQLHSIIQRATELQKRLIAIRQQSNKTPS